MSQNTPENYLEEVPDSVDRTQEEWKELDYHGQYYLANDRREELRQDKKRRRAEKREWLNKKKAEAGCDFCEEDTPVCLDYHHIGEKKQIISEMLDYSKESILEEMEKCVLVCANCHRKVHEGIIDVDQKI